MPQAVVIQILVLITVIMLTDLAFDGFRFALWAAREPGIAHEASFAFVGNAIAQALAPLSTATLQFGYRTSLTLHRPS